jgi:PAS domain S-box-containing protein
MIGAHTDVTKHRHTEELLRIAAAAFETQDGIIVTDVNKIILRVNNAFCRITGYSPEEVVNQDTSFL